MTGFAPTFTRCLNCGLYSCRCGRDAQISDSQPESPSNPLASRPHCDPTTQTFCDTGWAIWKRWLRAQMLANQHRDYSGYEQASSDWRNHLREGRRP